MKALGRVTYRGRHGHLIAMTADAMTVAFDADVIDAADPDEPEAYWINPKTGRTHYTVDVLLRRTRKVTVRR